MENSTVTVKVWPSNLLFLVFDRWEDGKGRALAETPEAQLIVTEPVELKAVWRIEYRTVAIAIVAGVLAFYARKRARKNRLTKRLKKGSVVLYLRLRRRWRGWR